MRTREMVRTVRQAKKKLSLQRSQEYIDSQLRADWLSALTLQMGPNCNRKCFHCYGDYGPHRMGLPQLEIVEKILEEAPNIGLRGILLTDGEPIRHENKKIMGLLANHSGDILFSIISNAAFARTWPNTLNWFSFLKDQGLNLKNSRLEISCGTMYRTHPSNFIRINSALREIFPDGDIGKFLLYRLIGLSGGEELEKEVRIIESVINSVIIVFGKKEKVFSMNKHSPRFTIYNKEGSPIDLHRIICRPAGRAKDFPVFDKNYPYKEVEVSDIGFTPDTRTSLWVSHDGRVSFSPGGSGQCVREGKFYGNIKDESLKDIKKKIKKDSVYQAFRLGGVRFLYYLAQKIDQSYLVVARTKCDVCNNFFEDTGLVRKVREHLERNEVIREYKNFVDQIDFRKRKYF